MIEPTESAWARLEARLADRFPALLRDLAPGADDGALAALAEATGLDLPASVRAFYRGHDGQRGEAAGLFFGLRFLSTDEAADEWGRWSSLLQDDPALVEDIGVDAWPAGAVRPVYAHPAWIPIASDGAGNQLAADLAPGPDGTPGQIISFGPDEPVRYVLAPSPADFLAWCADLLESGQGLVAPDSNAPGGKVLRLVKAGNLLDALPALLGRP